MYGMSLIESRNYKTVLLLCMVCLWLKAGIEDSEYIVPVYLQATLLQRLDNGYSMMQSDRNSWEMDTFQDHTPHEQIL